MSATKRADGILLVESVTAVRLIRSIDELPAELQGGAVAIGNFDGVHRGHAVLLERLVEFARSVGGPAIVFTFDPHPAQLLYPEAVPPPLTWTERKAQLLADLGADATVAYPTDRAVLSLAPQEFFDRIIRGQLHARAIVEGPNFYFGRNRSGSVEDLRRMCREAGLAFEVVEPAQASGRLVSSSLIRDLIQAGEIRQADALLTQPYRIHGAVVRGAGRGSQIGFPTANVEPVGMVLPPLGVYAGCATVAGRVYPAAVNIGPNPTFGEAEIKFESHLIGCHQDLYGEILYLDFLDRLRDIRPFTSVDALQRQLADDVRAVRAVVGDCQDPQTRSRLR
jgi:riboflavin kinase/FMN adenylyltransferase